MGEIVVNVGLENYVDRSTAKSGLRTEPVRRTHVDGVVDTGAVMIMLPENVVERLGLEPLRTAIVTCADERREERQVAGPVAIEVCDRFMVTECVSQAEVAIIRSMRGRADRTWHVRSAHRAVRALSSGR